MGALAAILLVASLASCQKQPFSQRIAVLGLEFVRDIPLPGSATRLDYQSIDEQSRRLYIAHLGADKVIVVDIDSLAVIKDIPDVPRPHGILAVPELGRVYVSATGVDQAFVIDEQSLHIVAKIDAGHYPDGIAFDPETKRVFVSDETGNTVSVIDAIRQSLIKKIHLGSEVGNTQYDPVSKMIYSAAQSVDELVAIDPKNLEIAGRYKLPGCRGPHGFTIDSTTHCAIVTGEGNGSYVVFDLTQKKVTSRGRVGSDPDVLAFDKGLQRLYVSAESGIVSAFSVKRGEVKKVGEAYFEANAHTVSVDQRTHLVFFPLEDLDGHPVLRVMRPISGK